MEGLHSASTLQEIRILFGCPRHHSRPHGPRTFHLESQIPPPEQLENLRCFCCRSLPVEAYTLNRGVHRPSCARVLVDINEAARSDMKQLVARNRACVSVCVCCLNSCCQVQSLHGDVFGYLFRALLRQCPAKNFHGTSASKRAENRLSYAPPSSTTPHESGLPAKVTLRCLGLGTPAQREVHL